MTRKRANKPDIEEIARQAHEGEDVSEHFTGNFTAKQRVTVDFSRELLKQIDAECRLIGVTRQSWIKMACDERLRQIRSGRP